MSKVLVYSTLTLSALLTCSDALGQHTTVIDEEGVATAVIACASQKFAENPQGILSQYPATFNTMKFHPQAASIIRDCEVIERLNPAHLRHMDLNDVTSAVAATTLAVSNANAVAKSTLDKISDILDRQTKLIEDLEKRVSQIEKRP